MCMYSYILVYVYVCVHVFTPIQMPIATQRSRASSIYLHVHKRFPFLPPSFKNMHTYMNNKTLQSLLYIYACTYTHSNTDLQTKRSNTDTNKTPQIVTKTLQMAFRQTKHSNTNSNKTLWIVFRYPQRSNTDSNNTLLIVIKSSISYLDRPSAQTLIVTKRYRKYQNALASVYVGKTPKYPSNKTLSIVIKSSVCGIQVYYTLRYRQSQIATDSIKQIATDSIQNALDGIAGKKNVQIPIVTNRYRQQ